MCKEFFLYLCVFSYGPEVPLDIDIFFRMYQTGEAVCNVSVYAGVVIGKTPPLEKTLPFTGAQNLCLQISNSKGGCTEKWLLPQSTLR